MARAGKAYQLESVDDQLKSFGFSSQNDAILAAHGGDPAVLPGALDLREGEAKLVGDRLELSLIGLEIPLGPPTVSDDRSLLGDLQPNQRFERLCELSRDFDDQPFDDQYHPDDNLGLAQELAEQVSSIGLDANRRVTELAVDFQNDFKRNGFNHGQPPNHSILCQQLVDAAIEFNKREFESVASFVAARDVYTVVNERLGQRNNELPVVDISREHLNNARLYHSVYQAALKCVADSDPNRQHEAAVDLAANWIQRTACEPNNLESCFPNRETFYTMLPTLAQLDTQAKNRVGEFLRAHETPPNLDRFFERSMSTPDRSPSTTAPSLLSFETDRAESSRLLKALTLDQKLQGTVCQLNWVGDASFEAIDRAHQKWCLGAPAEHVAATGYAVQHRDNPSELERGLGAILSEFPSEANPNDWRFTSIIRRIELALSYVGFVREAQGHEGRERTAGHTPHQNGDQFSTGGSLIRGMLNAEHPTIQWHEETLRVFADHRDEAGQLNVNTLRHQLRDILSSRDQSQSMSSYDLIQLALVFEVAERWEGRSFLTGAVGERVRELAGNHFEESVIEQDSAIATESLVLMRLLSLKEDEKVLGSIGTARCTEFENGFEIEPFETEEFARYRDNPAVKEKLAELLLARVVHLSEREFSSYYELRDDWQIIQELQRMAGLTEDDFKRFDFNRFTGEIHSELDQMEDEDNRLTTSDIAQIINDGLYFSVVEHRSFTGSEEDDENENWGWNGDLFSSDKGGEILPTIRRTLNLFGISDERVTGIAESALSESILDLFSDSISDAVEPLIQMADEEGGVLGLSPQVVANECIRFLDTPHQYRDSEDLISNQAKTPIVRAVLGMKDVESYPSVLDSIFDEIGSRTLDPHQALGVEGMSLLADTLKRLSSRQDLTDELRQAVAKGVIVCAKELDRSDDRRTTWANDRRISSFSELLSIVEAAGLGREDFAQSSNLHLDAFRRIVECVEKGQGYNQEEHNAALRLVGLLEPLDGMDREILGALSRVKVSKKSGGFIIHTSDVDFRKAETLLELLRAAKPNTQQFVHSDGWKENIRRFLNDIRNEGNLAEATARCERLIQLHGDNLPPSIGEMITSSFVTNHIAPALSRPGDGRAISRALGLLVMDPSSSSLESANGRVSPQTISKLLSEENIQKLRNRTIFATLQDLVDPEPESNLKELLPAARVAGIVSNSEEPRTDEQLIRELKERVSGIKQGIDSLPEGAETFLKSLTDEYGIDFASSLLVSPLYAKVCDSTEGVLEASRGGLAADEDLRAAVVKKVMALGKAAEKKVGLPSEDFQEALNLTRRWCDLSNWRETAWIPVALGNAVSDSRHVDSGRPHVFSHFHQSCAVHPGLVALSENLGFSDAKSVKEFYTDGGRQYLRDVLPHVSRGHIPRLTKDHVALSKEVGFELIEFENVYVNSLSAESVSGFIKKKLVPLIETDGSKIDSISRVIGILQRDASPEVAASLPQMFDGQVRQRLQAQVVLKGLETSGDDARGVEGLLPAALGSGLLESRGNGASDDLSALVEKLESVKRLMNLVPKAPKDALEGIRSQYGDVFLAELVTSEWYENAVKHESEEARETAINKIKADPQLLSPIVAEVARKGTLSGGKIKPAEFGASQREAAVLEFERAIKLADQWCIGAPEQAKALAWIPATLKAQWNTCTPQLMRLFDQGADVHPSLRALRENFKLGRDNFEAFHSKKSTNEYGAFVLDQAKEGYIPRLSNREETLTSFQTYFKLSLVDVEKMFLKGFEPLQAWQTKSEDGYKAIFLALGSACSDRWGREVVRPFERGAEQFGYQFMFAFGQRDGLSPHDSYQSFERIVGMFDAFNKEARENGQEGITAQRFRSGVLEAIVKDRAVYNAGTAHHRLNQIVDTIPPSFGEVRRKAERFAALSDMGPYLESFQSPTDVISSWNDLRRWSDFAYLVESESGRLEGLVALQDRGESAATVQFVSNVILDRESRVDLKKTFLMVEDPARFLANSSDPVGDLHLKKLQPIAYTEFPFLDLTPKGLVNDFTAGRLENGQFFQPYSVEYLVPKDGRERATKDRSDAVREGLRVGIGSRRNNIRGEAQDPSKLFAVGAEILGKGKDGRDKLLSYLAADSSIELQPEELGKLEILVFANDKMGLPQSHRLRKKNSLIPVRVTMHPKSSSEGVKAGNDTWCCMPWGSAKMTNYTFNAVTGILTVQTPNANGRWRTIGQSVVTLDHDIGKAPDYSLLNNIAATGIHQVLNDRAMADTQRYITCDNIEMSPNFKSSDQMVAAAYADFFARYTEEMGPQWAERGDQVVSDQILVGQGYLDVDKNLFTSRPNTFWPAAPVAYSDNFADTDNFGKYVSVLTPKRKEGFAVLKAERLGDGKLSSGPVPLSNSQFRYLRAEHALETAVLESKAYQRSSLREGPWTVMNRSHAIDLNNSATERPALSIGMWADKDGPDGRNGQLLTAYIIAYEGRVQEGDNSGEYGSDLKVGDRVVYVADWASPESRFAGVRVLQEWLRVLKETYASDADKPKLVFEARSATSLPIVEKMLGREGWTVDSRVTVDSGEAERAVMTVSW